MDPILSSNTFQLYIISFFFPTSLLLSLFSLLGLLSCLVSLCEQVSGRELQLDQEDAQHQAGNALE